MLARDSPALWVTSWPLAEYVKHGWAGAWECSTFRNEGTALASAMIREAVAVTRYVYGEPPALGMITFVHPTKVAGFITRTKEGPEMRWGYSYWKAGFRFCGWTKGNLYALQMLPEDMPAARAPYSPQYRMFDAEPSPELSCLA